MKVRVGVAFDVMEAGRVPDADQLAAHLDDVLSALMDLENVTDPDVSATLSEGLDRGAISSERCGWLPTLGTLGWQYTSFCRETR
jgi:hypothetical protein